MATPLTFATREQIQAYALARGLTNATSTDPVTNEPYTTEQVAQADLRGNDYIWQRFYNHFRPEFQADTLDALPADVALRLQRAASIAAIHELEIPNRYSFTFDPATTRTLKKAGDLEWEVAKPSSATASAINGQAIDVTIHQLLDAYLIVPESPNSTANVCPEPTGDIAGGIMGVTARC